MIFLKGFFEDSKIFFICPGRLYIKDFYMGEDGFKRIVEILLNVSI